jgi:hypothetical protein
MLVNAEPNLEQRPFDKYESVILTSTTLSTGTAEEKRGFDFFAGRIGLDDFNGAKLGSSFGYQRILTS